MSESAVKDWDYDEIIRNYIIDGKSILQKEYDAWNITNNPKEEKEDWKLLLDINTNTCAIKLSWALNHAGYVIPKLKTVNYRNTWISSLNNSYHYILNADDMGYYLKKKLGKPTFKSDGPIKSDSALVKFIDKILTWQNYGGIIFLDSKNHKVYNASGHVDLIYEDSGNDAHILGNNQDLENYIDWRNGDGFLNTYAELECKRLIFGSSGSLTQNDFY